jgi:membrane protease subunit HflK
MLSSSPPTSLSWWSRLSWLVSAFHILWVDFLAYVNAHRFARYRASSFNEPLKAQQPAPPDLDEVFREWRKKIDRLWNEVARDGKSPRGNKQSDDQGNGGLPNMPISVSLLGGLLAGIVLVIWLLSGFYVVDSNERAVVMQFGRFTHVTEPGLNWRLPYPFQSHVKVNYSSVRTLEIGSPRASALNSNPSRLGTQMLTGDENVILVQYTVQYDVREADGYVLNDVSPDMTAQLAAETAMREVVGSNRLDSVLYEDRELVARKAREIMQSILDRYGSGIRVIRVNLQSVRPPEQVQAAFDDAITASQDRQRQINEGEAYAQDVVPRARGVASRMLAEAQGYRESVIAKANGEASRFSAIYEQYQSAKAVTRERMYLDTLSEVLSRSQKILVDPQSKAFIQLTSPSQNTIPLPMLSPEDNVKKQALPAPAPATSSSRLSNRRN